MTREEAAALVDRYDGACLEECMVRDGIELALIVKGNAEVDKNKLIAVTRAKAEARAALVSALVGCSEEGA